MLSHRPAWQTEELAEEWVDQDEHSSAQDSVSSHAVSSSDISLTEALPSTFIRGGSISPAPSAVGTFVVKDDVPATPLRPKTPGKKNKNQIKDFFSPMPLETMFDPPSPPPANVPLPSTFHQTTAPTIPSRLSKVYIPSDKSSEYEADDEILETDIPNMVGFDGRKPRMNCQFTFSIPDPSQATPMAQSTPSSSTRTQPIAPPTDPRLRLFQFQYDTFTRDHLSAMVDSIAVNTPSGGSGSSPSASGNILSRVTEVEGESMSRMRSTKRIKLTPANDFSEEASPNPDPPQAFSRKDYVGESKNLMEQIRLARDFSTISSVTSAKSHTGDNLKDDTITRKQAPQVYLNIPSSTSDSSAPSSGTTSSKRSGYSSLGYRQQAADLMAQIKQDMKGSRRLFSGDTEVSHVTRVESDPPLSNKENEPHQGRLKRGPHSRVDSELATEFGNMSIEVWQTHVHVNVEPTHSKTPYVAVIPPTPASTAQSNQHLLVPPNGPTYPSSSIRAGTNEDLNRFVSSSTTTGTTLTAGSAESFVKHAGPKQMTRIGPEDVAGALSDRIGKMVLNRETMRWVRDTALISTGVDGRGGSTDDAESEDPFRDIESLRDDDSRTREEEEGKEENRLAVVEEVEAEDVEEAALNSFSFDDLSTAVVQVMTGVEQDEEDSGYSDMAADDTTDSDDPGDDELETTQHRMQEIQEFSLNNLLPPTHSGAAFSTPLPTRSKAGPAGSTPFPSIRSVLKSNSQTPVSAMKDPNRNKTPSNSGHHRRSVSFSDGKRDGPIRGLTRNTGDDNVLDADSEDPGHVKSGTGSLFVPSARSKRIADMLEGFEDQMSDLSLSPTKSSNSTGRPSSTELHPLAHRQPSTVTNSAPANGESSRTAFSRYHSRKPPNSVVDTAANATFLTECSFGVAHDRLVQVLTDVQPFEPYWEELTCIDISSKNVDSVARLKEFMPKLESLCLNNNQISWLSGVPGTVRTLSAASNMLTGVTSFGHLINIEHLDISRNDVDSLQQLHCLRGLRELRADGNKIRSIDGLQKMHRLVKLSLQSNQIRDVDFTKFQWTRLEMLNLSQNGLDSIQGLKALSALIALNLDENMLTDLELDSEDACMGKLKILRVSGNKLQRLDGARYPNLRTLYADNNTLSTISRCNLLRRLENLSLRNQAKGKLNLSIRDVRDLKRLYLSGNPLTSKFMTEPCYNLIYFELAACRLTALPPNFGHLVPNVRVLNLNYNFLEDVKPLEGLTRIRKLTIIGSRVKGTKGLIKMTQGMPEIEMVDFRMNPCTLGWYLPLLVRDVPSALQPSEEGSGTRGMRSNPDVHEEKSEKGGESGKYPVWRWQDLDSKFRRDLPDEAYVGRLAYRGLIMRACQEIRVLDGVEVSDKERDKASRLLTGILGKSRAELSEMEQAPRI